MKILVTGAAGFIGFHTVIKLLSMGETVVGIDNMNDYYNPQLKYDRLDELKKYDHYENFTFIKGDLADDDFISRLFQDEKFDSVIHLAAQAGVRYSIENPKVYIQSNIVGFLNILEGCRHNKIKHLVYASSSSVYGANTKQPFSEEHNVDHPVSLYAASKKSNELMAHSYANLYGMSVTGLRFFTVYGPWGRPDMSPILFASGIAEDREIKVFNNGEMSRDFTYIDDIVEGIVNVLHKPADGNSNWSGDEPDPSSSYCKYRVYNIGNNQPVKLLDFIQTIENAMGKEAKKNFMPMQDGDVKSTYASTDKLTELTGYKPSTDLKVGIDKFVAWFKDYYA